jgi:hypothetical protein
MIAALNNGKIVAPMTFEGYCDTEVFNGWFEQFLAPILQPEQTVILNNATFHKSKKIVEFAKTLVQKFCISLRILLTLITLWFAIKNRARKNIPLFKSFRQAVDSAFLHLFPLL